MPSMATTSEIRAWLRGQNIEVGDKGALPARLIATYNRAHDIAGPRILPGPDDLDDLPPLSFGTVDVDVPPLERETPPSGPPPSGGPDPEPEPGEDEPPPHARREWHAPKRGAKTKPKPPRITVGIRGDIQAKVSFALQVPGAIWQARDPICGGTFVQQIPDTAEAFTDIICDSPDLIAFFTGPGGNFMKALKVGAALMPVVQVVMAHHVYHSIEMAPEQGEPDYQQYAA